MRAARRSPSGGAVIWKPSGLTSRQALERVERRLGFRPLGHTGTLDPLASGVLVLLGGEARKFQDLITNLSKEYAARIALGINSASEDGEGPLWCVVPRRPYPSRDELEEALREFSGTVQQVPPRLSAVRIAGERSHVRTRRGERVRPPARRVVIESIEITAYEPPILRVIVRCGSGTYLRSLARDLGERLGTGAFLCGLRRTAVGPFGEHDATPLAVLDEAAWRAPEALFGELPRVEVDPPGARLLSNGQRVGMDDTANVEGRAVAWCEGQVLGLVEARGRQLYPRRWLAFR